MVSVLGISSPCTKPLKYNTNHSVNYFCGILSLFSKQQKRQSAQCINPDQATMPCFMKTAQDLWLSEGVLKPAVYIKCHYS